jgi:hypothetical protein
VISIGHEYFASIIEKVSGQWCMTRIDDKLECGVDIHVLYIDENEEETDVASKVGFTERVYEQKSDSGR